MSADPHVRARIFVNGRVQGVAYRAFTQHEASRRGLRGGVRNLDDGRVEVEVEGPKGAVEVFMEVLRTGPPMARVDELDIRWEAPTGQHVDFRIWS